MKLGFASWADTKFLERPFLRQVAQIVVGRPSGRDPAVQSRAAVVSTCLERATTIRCRLSDLLREPADGRQEQRGAARDVALARLRRRPFPLRGQKRKAQPEQMTFTPHQIAEAPWAMLCLSPFRGLAMDRISHQT